MHDPHANFYEFLHSTRFTFCTRLESSSYSRPRSLSFFYFALHTNFIFAFYIEFSNRSRAIGEFEGKRKKSICRVNRYSTKWLKKKRKGGTREGRKRRKKKELGGGREKRKNARSH